MTDREKAIVMAYTGTVMLAGEKLDEYYKYVAELIGRPVWTHEFADRTMAEEIRVRAKADFLRVCRESDVPVTYCHECMRCTLLADGAGWHCEAWDTDFYATEYDVTKYYCADGKRRG